MSEPVTTEDDDLRAAFLARLRLEFIQSKIDTLKIERLGVALKCGLISVRQALALDMEPKA